MRDWWCGRLPPQNRRAAPRIRPWSAYARLIFAPRPTTILELPEYVWLDGYMVRRQDAVVPVTTHSLHYGTTAFEGIRAYWNGDNLNVFRLADHIRRLRNSGRFYNMVLPYTDLQVHQGILDACGRNGFRQSVYVRPLYFIGEWEINMYGRTEPPIRFAILALPLQKPHEQSGVAAGVVSHRRAPDQSTPVQAKMAGNYLNFIAAITEARRNGFECALMLDIHGNVSESPGANIFLVQEGRLVTPDRTSSILEGITMDSVMRLAADDGIPCVRRAVSPSELHASDEVFLTGTAAEVVPIARIDGRDIGDGGTGPVTRRIMELYQNAVNGRIPARRDWLTPVY